MTTTVVGVFDTDAAAQSAVSQLRDLGVQADNISVMARPSGEIVNEHGDVIDVPEDHMTAGEGVTVGAVWGGLVGLAAVALPGVGPLVTSNIFTALLTGAVAGAATGGIAGALIDAASVPEDHAQVYEHRIRAGSTLVTAQVDDAHATQARSIMHTSGAEEFNWDDPTTFDYNNDSASQNYAESSKVGTVGGGTAGAVTGAAMGAVGGPVGAVIGGIAGAVVGGSVGAVGDTIGESAEDVATGEDSMKRGPNYTTGVDADLNRLDEPGYVAGGMSSSSDEAAYEASSKVGTVGGGTAGAVTGAAIGAAGGPVGAVIGGIAGAVVGGSAGAVGDTVGEKADGETVDHHHSHTADTQPSYTARTDRDDTTLRDEAHDVVTDDQGDDTFRTADHAYDESSKAGTVGGATAGAVTGAAIGSVGGPVGTVIGGVAGAISGAAAGAVGDTIGEEADEEIGAFSRDNKEQYKRTADKAKNKAADTWNATEDGLDADLDRDGDVGRRG